MGIRVFFLLWMGLGGWIFVGGNWGGADVGI